MKIYRIVLHAFLFAFIGAGIGNALNAQAILKLGAQGVLNYPTVVNYDDSVSLAFYVVNSGTTPFSDTIITRQVVNGNPVKSIDTTGTVMINPGDSVLVTIVDYDFLDPDFVLGRNGIVVWVTDDNLSPAVNEDSAEVFLTDGPAFRFGNMGITGFPLNAETGTVYSFFLHVENYHLDEYLDTLYITVAVNGDTLEYPSAGKVWLPGLSSIVYNQQGFEFQVPPFALGSNAAKIWIRGTEDAMAIDTALVSVQLGEATSAGEATDSYFRNWPNPAVVGDRINIQSEKVLERIVVVDFSGEIVLEASVSGKAASFDTGPLKNGIFVLGIFPKSGPPHFRKLILR